MSTNNPFGPGSPLHDLFKRQRELQRMLGPTHELQERIKSLQGPLATIAELQRAGTLAGLTPSSFHADSIKALQAIATPTWMLALQKTAADISRDDLGILKTQRLLASAVDSDALKLARTFDTHRPIVEAMMTASKWTEQFRTLSQQFAPDLAGIKAAAESARMLDMMTLRATAGAVAKSAVVVAAEQVLEAHRLIEAISQSDSPAQSASLLTALLSLMAAIFSGFGENTLKELRGIGAVKLIELFMLAIAFHQWVAPPDMSAAEKKVVAEMRVEVETLQDKLDRILKANEQANEAHVANLPRGELKREVAIRRAGEAKAPVLMKGAKGQLIAVKETRGRWCLVVYRDPLTDQLSEGWVYAPAVQLLDPPAR